MGHTGRSGLPAAVEAGQFWPAGWVNFRPAPSVIRQRCRAFRRRRATRMPRPILPSSRNDIGNPFGRLGHYLGGHVRRRPSNNNKARDETFGPGDIVDAMVSRPPRGGTVRFSPHEMRAVQDSSAACRAFSMNASTAACNSSTFTSRWWSHSARGWKAGSARSSATRGTASLVPARRARRKSMA